MTNNNNKVMMSKKVEKIAALAIFFLVFVASSVAHAQDTLRLTLDDALKIATSENLTVKIADKVITRQD